MMFTRLTMTSFLFSAIVSLLSPSFASADTADVGVLLQQLDNFPHTKRVDFSEQEVIDYEIGLGAMQKLRGEWRFKRSERQTGMLTRYTWLIENGFSSAEVMEELLQQVASIEGAEELFSCDGRSCGRAAEWANGVFHNRVLFGREGLQRYRVYALPGEGGSRLLSYSAERTADRQYLHVEWLQIAQ